MANIKLKDRVGQEVPYYGVDKITVADASSGTDDFFYTSGTLSITPTTAAITENVDSYHMVSVAAIPTDPLDDSIIDGEPVSEGRSDYAWKSIVTIPAGYHSAQVITKNFSDVLPDLGTSEAKNSQLLSGYKLYDHKGKVVSGTMEPRAAEQKVLDETVLSYTIPAGYHNGTGTVSHVLGAQGIPTAAKGSVSNHTISVTPSCTDTTGYILGTTKTGDAVTVSASELVDGKLDITNTSVVDVTNYASAQIVDANLLAENIKKDASILGITGSLDYVKTVSSVPATKDTGIIYNSTDSNYYLWRD